VSTAGSGPVLVTGATGFAGSHLVDYLLDLGEWVAGWARAGARAGWRDPRVGWQEVDVLDRGAVADAIRDLRPRTVFHLAGLPHVGESWKQADRALAVNALGTHHLVDALEQHAPGCRLIVSGSALVYRPSLEALREDSPVGPADPYGISKLAQEMRVAQARVAAVRTRPFNHAGPRQSEAFVTSSFAKQIAEIEAGLRPPTLQVGNLDARRDITDVRDTVRAYAALGTSGTPGAVYNICSGTAHKVGDLLEQLLRLSNARIDVRQDPARMRPSDNPVVLGDHSRVTADTGWAPSIPIAQTLGDLLAWWRSMVRRAP
jgi:GDP-4-dehydro-6-deoxy-D-mannose reductase